DDRVVAVVGEDLVARLVAGDDVGRRTADDVLRADDVVVLAGGAVVRLAVERDVDAAGDPVVVVAHEVGTAGPAVEDVRTAAPDERVVADAALQDVGVVVAGEHVAAVAAADVLDPADGLARADVYRRQVQVDGHRLAGRELRV